MTTIVESGSAPSAPWPAHLLSDYDRATVRLVTVAAGGVTYLLFACVEFLPHEIPSPAPIPPEKLDLRPVRLMHSLSVFPAAKALAWYEAVAQGRVLIPGTAYTAMTGDLAVEPPLGTLVVAERVPVSAPWHSDTRMNHLLPMNDPPAPVADLLPDGSPQQGRDRRDKARRWAADRVHFDLLGADEWVGGAVLLAPNPVLRDLGVRLTGTNTPGGEIVKIRAVPRTGCDPTALVVRVAEHRNDGTAWSASANFDDTGAARFLAPGRIEDVSLQLECPVRGLLASHPPTGFIREFNFNLDRVSAETRVAVPPRSRGGPVIYHYGSVLTSASPPPAPPPETTLSRLRALRRRGELRPRMGQEPGIPSEDDYLFMENRAEAVLLLRALVGGARRRLVLVDPYFDHRDLREFASAVRYPDCRISMLTGSDGNRWRAPDKASAEGHALGALMATDIAELNRALQRNGDTAFDVRVMEPPSRSYHDRFLVADDTAWHLGHSFNALGNGEVAMVSRVRRPEPIIALIEEDVARATRFESAWVEMLRRAPGPPGGHGWP